MPELIRKTAGGAERVQDVWIEAADEVALADAPSGSNVIVPLELWQSQRDTLLANSQKTGAKLGVKLAPADDPAALAGVTGRLALIAVEFPQFADGRGYSIARLLRERYGYKGELRAVGDVLRDQLFYMWRCGFDAFALKEGKSIEDALRAFDDFSEVYQASVEQPVPLFKRRLAA